MSDLHEYREYPKHDPRHLPKSYDHLSSLRETVKEFHDSPTVASLCRPPGKVPKEPRKKFTEEDHTTRVYQSSATMPPISKETQEWLVKSMEVPPHRRPKPPPPPRPPVDREYTIPHDSWINRLSKGRERKKPAEEVRPHGSRPVDPTYYAKLATPAVSKMSDLAKIKTGLMPKPEKPQPLAATGSPKRGNSPNRTASPARAATAASSSSNSNNNGGNANAANGGGNSAAESSGAAAAATASDHDHGHGETDDHNNGGGGSNGADAEAGHEAGGPDAGGDAMAVTLPAAHRRASMGTEAR